jgi:hypothetical protein
VIFIAGKDKPHRCPACWSCYGYKFMHRRIYNWDWLYRLRLWFPRKCHSCGALTLTTSPWHHYEIELRGDK